MDDSGCAGLGFVILLAVLLVSVVTWANSYSMTRHHGIVIQHVASQGYETETILQFDAAGKTTPIYGQSAGTLVLVVREGQKIHKLDVGDPNYLRFKDGDPIDFTVNGNDIAFLPAVP